MHGNLSVGQTMRWQQAFRVLEGVKIDLGWECAGLRAFRSHCAPHAHCQSSCRFSDLVPPFGLWV